MSKTATYSLIESQTLGSAQATVTFSSIPTTFTDLILVIRATTISANFNMRFNGDTGTNYSYTSLWGDGSSAASYRSSNNTVIGLTYTSSGAPMSRIQIQDYSNATTYKSVLIRQDDSANAAGAVAALWRSTAAINSIAIVSGGTIPSGSTFKLYGIQAGNA
jgi:hypothetical protein